MTVHWFRVTHADARRDELRERLIQQFGEPDKVHGKWFYEHGERFGNGTMLMWGSITKSGKEAGLDDSPGAFCIDIPGSALDDMQPHERAETCHELSLGGRVTRLDLAVDAYHDEDVGLIDAIQEACKAGELCGARRWEPKAIYNSGFQESDGVCIGRRGKSGSGRYVRVYDKGLESKTLEKGRWQRFEVEFTGDAAAEAAAHVFCDAGDWEPRAWARLNGAISFRKAGGNGSLARRPLLDWWEKWINAAKPLSTIPKRAQTTLEKHTRWLTQTVLPTVATLAQTVQVPFTDALVHLVGTDIRPRANDRTMKSMLHTWRQLLRERPVIAATF